MCSLARTVLFLLWLLLLISLMLRLQYARVCPVGGDALPLQSPRDEINYTHQAFGVPSRIKALMMCKWMTRIFFLLFAVFVIA